MFITSNRFACKFATAEEVPDGIEVCSVPPVVLVEDVVFFEDCARRLCDSISTFIGSGAANEDQIQQGREAAKYLEHHTDGRSGTGAAGAFGLVYLFGDLPLGMADVKAEDGRLTVFSMSVHPDTSGVGSALITESVNLSQGLGLNGKLVLVPDDSYPATPEIYKRWGFTADPTPDPGSNEPTLELDPMTSDAWVRRGDSWALRSKPSWIKSEAGEVSASIGPYYRWSS